MQNKSLIPIYLEKLDNAVGVSGYENEVAALIAEEMNKYCDEIARDSLGNNIFVKKSKKSKSRIMLCAHMDELGFMVHFIEENGMIRFVPIGYHDERMIVGQDLLVHSRGGNIPAITGTKPPHVLSEEELKKAIPLYDMYADVGTVSRKDTERLGIRIGDVISYNRKGIFLNDGKIYSGKAVDDRAGCAVLIEVMKRLKEIELSNTIYAVTTVMEEIGMRGASAAANSIKPDMAIVIDVTLAGGIPGLQPRDLPIELGKGVAIKFFDWAPKNAMAGIAVSRQITDQLIAIAEKEKIPYQREVLMDACTDAWPISISGSGVKTCVISIPSRYIHTATGVVDMDDLESIAQLIVAYINFLEE